MAYFRPGLTVPDDVPLAALNGEYDKYQDEVPRPLFRDRPEEAPRFQDATSESSAWYIFWHCDVSEENQEEGLALWSRGNTPVLTKEQLGDVRRRESWDEVPGYTESTETERSMVRGIAGLWLFEMAKRETLQRSRREDRE